MTLFAIENLLICLSCAILSIIIFRYAANSSHRIWGVFNLVVTYWSFNMFMVGISTNPEDGLKYWKLANAGVSFIAVVFYHFIYLFCKLKQKIFLWIFYAYAIIFGFLSLTADKITSSVFLYFDSIYYHHATLMFKIMMTLWLGIVIFSFTTFYSFLKRAPETQKKQIKFMFWTMLIGFIGGFTTALPTMDIFIYPGFQGLIAIYVSVITYAIFKHDILPINTVMKRSIIYSLLITVISLVYFVVIFLFERLSHAYMGYTNIINSLVASLIIAIIFIPLRNKIQSLVDQLFFSASPVQMSEENKLLREEVAQTEKLKAIATLASGLAHEIRNPLTALQTFNDHLPQKKNDHAFLDKYHKIASTEIERINALLSDLLAFAKPSLPQIQTVNPSEIILNLLAMLDQKLQSKKIALATNFETTTSIQADPNHIKQALLNLIMNAIDAMPNGGQLVIKSELKDDFYVLHISDTGIGIKPEDLKQIFDPFFTNKEKGTGLGLSITLGIIEKHAGRITVESILNHGTTFTISLPVSHAT